MEIYHKDRQISSDICYPVGAVLPFAGLTPADGWLLCDGAAYDKSDYPVLYEVIGDLYNTSATGDTFNVPDLRERFVEGAGTGNYDVGKNVAPSIPSHSHSFSGTAVNSTSSGSHTHTRNTLNFTGNAYCDSNGNTLGTHTGAFSGSVCSGGCGSKDWNCSYGVANVCLKASDNWSGATSEIGTHYHSITAKGTLSKAGDSLAIYKGTTVQPKSCCMNFIIRCK